MPPMTARLLRSLDLQVCDAFPPGTHFLWHLFNGVMLYCLFAGLVAGSGPGGLQTQPLSAGP